MLSKAASLLFATVEMTSWNQDDSQLIHSNPGDDFSKVGTLFFVELPVIQVGQ